jgi:protein-tyrosine phosphatase
MAHLGHDMSRHRSRTVSGALLDSADLIFTMEGNHKEALVAEFPASAEKIFLFSEMTGYPQDIRDPYGGSVIDYQEAIQEIAAYIEKGFEKVIELSQR